MDIFHHDLEPVEKLGFCILNFTDEVLGEVFVYDTIAGCKESQDVLDKVALIIVELVGPVMEVLLEVYFFSSPEIGL